MTGPHTAPSDATRQQVQAWRDELIDLTLRNRLLNYKPTRSSSLEIVAPSVGEVLAGLRSKGWAFHYPPLPDESSDSDDDVFLRLATEAEMSSSTGSQRARDELEAARVTAKDLTKILHNLQRRASSEYADKGLRVLYLGFGSLRWSDAEGADEQRSPLLLVPVELQRTTSRASFRLVPTDDDTVFNPALVVKLELEHGITLDIDAEVTELDQVLDEVRQRIGDQPRWRVTEDVVLAPFSFHKEAMYRDLKENEATICAHRLVGALTTEPGEASGDSDLAFEPIDDEQIDDLAPPEEAASILDADSTQRQCIAAAAEGRTFVIHGPPGTGKSQTIANVIAELLARDKTVLFVSEKAAALDVVKSRLDAHGLGHYVLELHSHKATRKAVAKELGRSLETRPAAARTMTPDELAEAARRRKELTAYAAAMNEVRPRQGTSLHELIGRCSRLSHLPSAPIPDQVDADLDRGVLDEMLEVAAAWARVWGPVERGDEFLWRDLADPVGVQKGRGRIEHDLAVLGDRVASVRSRAEAFAEDHALAAPATFDDLATLGALADLVARRCDVPPAWLTGSLEPVDALQRERATAWEDQRTDLDALQAVAGSTCESLDPAAANELIDLVAALRRLDPGPNVAGEHRASGLDSIVAAASAAAELATDMDASTADLARTLSVAGPAPDERMAAAVGHAATLAANANRPERSWLEPAGLDAARSAARVLRPIVERHRELVAQIGATFSPQVADLDVEAFYDGPQDLAPKLSRVSGRGRANRAQLRACSPGGKVTKEVLATLPAVRQWRATNAELATLEPSMVGPLGARYYQRQETDLGALDQALTVADQALSLLSTLGGGDGLHASLGADAVDPTAVAEKGRRLLDLVGQWQQPDAALAGTDLITRLGGRSFADIAAHLTTAHDVLAAVAAASHRVAAVAGDHGLDTLLEVARLRVATAHRADELARTHGDDRTVLGPRYLGAATDWSEWSEDRAWADAVRTTLGRSADEDQARRLLAATVPEGLVTPDHDMACKEIRSVLDLFLEDRAAALRDDATGRLDDAEELVAALRAQIGEVEEWAAYSTSRDRLRALGLGALVDHLEAAAVLRADLVGTVERAVLTAVIDDILASDRRCLPSLSDERDELVRRFRALDREIVAHAAARVIEVCNAKRPRTVVGEAATIQKEALKKVRHRPIRTLLGDAGRVAQSLRPCFMMSPLTVSQFLPPTLRFDVVIFDEASQVRPCDAVNAVYRGDQLIVAGDDKQLPPTSFFARTTAETDDEYDESQLDVFDSVLDLCESAGEIPSLPLRWHYRSRHESLITYSNRAFYDGRLVTYPGALEEGDDVGLQLFHVAEGVYRRGEGRDNPVEARAVVERVLHHADLHPDRSIGVVAFSEAQASRIEYELEAALRDRPHLEDVLKGDRLDGFFIKNLESVQGDERDIIVFSIGYGRDEDGKLTMNFGPLNREGGQRRLNVAVTRARFRVEVVTSIRAADFALTSTPGVNHLRRYLDFAERGLVALSADDVDAAAEAESPFEEDVLGVIRSLGYDPQPQVGQAGYRIDIGIRDPERPGRFVLGVECDGAAYHSSRAARDRDRLRQDVLEGLGWSLHRIWGPSWYRNRAGETTRLQRSIEAAIRGDVTTPEPVVASAPLVEIIDVELDDLPEWSVPYRPSSLGYTFYGSKIDDPANAMKLRGSILTVAEAEGPVSMETCLARVREGWRVGRMTARLRALVDDATDAMVALGEIHRTPDGFLYVDDGQLDVVRHADAEDTTTIRKVADVSQSELSRALLGIVRDAGSATADELTTRVSRLFGWGRKGGDISAALRRSLVQLEADAEVIEDDAGRYSVVTR